MDKSLFEKYIAEMKELRKRSTLPIPASAEYNGAEREDATELTPFEKTESEETSELTNSLPEQDTDQMTGKGYLVVNVTSVRELYPIPNAKITVFTGEEDNRKIFAQGVTDISGKAGPFELSAPNIEYSETPNSSVLPFSYYNILTEAEGFVDTIHLGIQVFDKVTSLQNVNLFAATANGENSTVIVNEFTEREVI